MIAASSFASMRPLSIQRRLRIAGRFLTCLPIDTLTSTAKDDELSSATQIRGLSVQRGRPSRQQSSSIHQQLRLAFGVIGLSEWELTRRANVRAALVTAALSGNEAISVGAMRRLAHALDLELILTPAEPLNRPVGAVPTVVDRAIMTISQESVHVADRSFKVLALDLEGTLISNAVSIFVRPGLARFLALCRPLFERVVIFTTVKEPRFRQIAATLVEEGSAPRWFSEIEYIAWSGPVKDLSVIPYAEVDQVLLVDDYAAYIHPQQAAQWIPIACFEPPFACDDSELDRVLEELVRRVAQASSR